MIVPKTARSPRYFFWQLLVSQNAQGFDTNTKHQTFLWRWLVGIEVLHHVYILQCIINIISQEFVWFEGYICLRLALHIIHISDEYAVANRELSIVKVENEVLPVLNSRRDFCICFAEYYGPDQERIKFNISITLTKDRQKKAGAHVENL